MTGSNPKVRFADDTPGTCRTLTALLPVAGQGSILFGSRKRDGSFKDCTSGAHLDHSVAHWNTMLPMSVASAMDEGARRRLGRPAFSLPAYLGCFRSNIEPTKVAI